MNMLLEMRQSLTPWEKVCRRYGLDLRARMEFASYCFEKGTGVKTATEATLERLCVKWQQSNGVASA